MSNSTTHAIYRQLLPINAVLVPKNDLSVIVDQAKVT
jgi:hypothetical protein